MHSDTNGPLTTFLLFVPLVAVPLLAVFGIPQFAPVVASPGADVVPELGSVVIEGDAPEQSAPAPFAPALTDDRTTTSPRGAVSTGEVGGTWNDPFQPSPQPVPNRSSPQPVPHGPINFVATTSEPRWTPPNAALDGWEPEPVPPRKAAPDSFGGRVRANFDERQQSQPDAAATADDRSNFGHDWGADQRQPQQEQAVPAFDRHPDAFLPIAESRRESARDNRNRFALEDNPFARRDTEADRSFNQQSAVSDQQAAVFNPDPEAPNPQSEPPSRFIKDDSIRRETSPGGSGDPQSSTGNSLPAEPLTWQSAVRRLKELDIRHFQLEPGERDDFHFSCYFTPSDNPRLTHCFEAEATEPLRAVEKVLTQIEQWREKR